jgi:hypothetical protein
MGLLMRPLALLISIASFLSLAACGSHIQELSTNSPFDENDETAVIVFRVKPKAWVKLARGRVDRNGWRSKRIASSTQFWPEHGLVVARVTPTADDEAYAILEIRPEHCTGPANLGPADKASQRRLTALWSPVEYYFAGAVMPAAVDAVTECPSYMPQGEAPLPVFDAVAGTVTYLGTIEVDASKDDEEAAAAPGKIGITPIAPSTDLDAVARFLARHYPKLRAGVTVGVMQMLRRNEYDF